MTDAELLGLNSDELLKLPNSDFTRCMELHEARHRANQTEVAPGYLDKTHQEKVSYWSGRMGQQMRWQAESGLDEYAGYTPEWRENLLRFEPHLDNLIREAFDHYLNWEWSYNEYCRRVGL